MRSRRGTLGLLLAILLPAGGACAYAGSTLPGDDPNDATLLVQNENDSAITVTLERAAFSFPLGAVPSRTERRFELPAAMVPAADMKLVIEVVATMETHVSNTLTVSAGEEIVYRVEEALALSSHLVASGLNRRR